MMSNTTNPTDQARVLLDGGDFEASRALALEALEATPNDPALLRIAGRASLELDRDDAVGYLEQATALEPDNAEGWRDLADAFLSEGRVGDAVGAIERTVALRPDDVGALVDLAHAAHAAGNSADAIGYLEQALERDFGNLDALRGLVGMYRSAGRLEDSLAAARKIVTYRPEDVVAAMDVAELTLELGHLEDALEAFRWLRDVDDEPDHEIYGYHGMIEAEIRRERWRPALDLAVEATRVDRMGRTTDVLAFAVAQVFGPSGRHAPDRRTIDDSLAASRDEHRLLHASHGF